MNEQGDSAGPVSGDAAEAAFRPEGVLEGAGRFDEILRYIEAGGPVVVILIALSVFALAIILLKIWQFHTAGIGEYRSGLNAVRLFRAGRAEEAMASLQSRHSPLAQVVFLAIRGRSRSDLAEQHLREEVLRHGAHLLESLRSYFRPLEVIASLAPLLGLFGTVLGMIEAFRQLEQAGNQVNPAILSGGIWAALLTTAAGLALAIPVVAILNWLERRVERLAHVMEDAVTQIFTQSLGENLMTAARNPRQQKNKEPADFPAVAAGE